MQGYSNAQSVMRGWMNSSGHRANILHSSFGKIGVGYVVLMEQPIGLKCLLINLDIQFISSIIDS